VVFPRLALISEAYAFLVGIVLPSYLGFQETRFAPPRAPSGTTVRDGYNLSPLPSQTRSGIPFSLSLFSPLDPALLIIFSCRCHRGNAESPQLLSRLPPPQAFVRSFLDVFPSPPKPFPLEAPSMLPSFPMIACGIALQHVSLIGLPTRVMF